MGRNLRRVPSLAAIAATISLPACHVTTRTVVTRPETTERVQHPEGAIAHRPALVLTDAGTLRFVEPLECPTEEIITTQTGVEVSTEPNLATFIVGVITTGVGGVLAVRGLTSASASNPSTFIGVGAVVVGLPLAIGPFVGTRTVLQPGEGSQGAALPVRRPGPSQPCGARPLAATSATLTIRGVEVHGAIDADGGFAISPYALVDAYDTKAIAGWDVSAVVDAKGGARTVTAVLDAGALAGRAQAFLAHADFDSSIEPMRLVPNLVVGTLRASLTSTATGPALRVVLPLKNDGPGDAYGLRGQLSSSTKAVDGRVLYIGKLAKGTTVSRELLIPLTVAAANTIRGETLELSVELRDAHGTAPTTPARFRGAVLNDAPR